MEGELITGIVAVIFCALLGMYKKGKSPFA